MKDSILTFAVLLLPALYLFTFIMGARWVLRRPDALWLKAVLILGMAALLVLISFMSWAAIYFASGGH